ncbi:MAG TPA: YezD family protein [Candidatus Binataceae bacterium]|nr:YezD family protein [Candidatus Binataceae bacterium]
MKSASPFDQPNPPGEPLPDNLERVIREVVRAIRNVNFGSVEIVIHDSRVVQIERKEKFRLDRA